MSPFFKISKPNDLIDKVIRLFPAITLLCYICGLIVINTHLIHFGIYDSTIINIKFIEAGILYLVYATFCLIIPICLYSAKKRSVIIISISASFAFWLLNAVFAKMNDKVALIGAAITGVLSIIIYLFQRSYSKQLEDKDITHSEIGLRVIIFLVITINVFGFYFKNIQTKFGGGQFYKKQLILKEKKENIVKTDSSLKTSILDIIYENETYLYFRFNNSTVAIKKNLLDAEIPFLDQ